VVGHEIHSNIPALAVGVCHLGNRTKLSEFGD